MLISFSIKFWRTKVKYFSIWKSPIKSYLYPNILFHLILFRWILSGGFKSPDDPELAGTPGEETSYGPVGPDGSPRIKLKLPKSKINYACSWADRELLYLQRGGVSIDDWCFSLNVRMSFSIMRTLLRNFWNFVTISLWVKWFIGKGPSFKLLCK